MSLGVSSRVAYEGACRFSIFWMRIGPLENTPKWEEQEKACNNWEMQRQGMHFERFTILTGEFD